MSPKDPAPHIRARLPVRLNILWSVEEPRAQPRVLCRSVHMCEPNGSLLPMQMAGGMCAVIGTASAQNGFELKNTHLVVLRRLPLAQLAVARAGHVLHLEEAVLAPRISSGSEVKKNHARTPRGTRLRVIASGAAFAQLPYSSAGLPSCFSKTLYRGEGGS